VKDGAGRDRDAEHFLQTKSLGAKLDLVVIPPSAFTAFVFDGKRHIGAIAFTGMELHEIGDADDTKAMTNEPQAASGAEVRLIVVTCGVNTTVIERTGDGVDIVAPQALQTMKGAAAWTKEDVVESRQRRIVVAAGGIGCGHDQFSR
jgi:hypothetical protein